MTLSEKLLNASKKLSDYAEAKNPHKRLVCPRCYSTNFVVTNKRINRAGWLIGGPILGLSNKTEAICCDCGKHFKI